MSPPTPYVELNHVLQDLVEGVQKILDDQFVGAYLQGSFAVGDFDEHSDVDFIIVSTDDLTAAAVEDLQVLHERVYALACPWAQHLEGSYFPRSILRHHPRSQDLLWYLDHGSRSLIPSGHCNTLVVRWVVRERGSVLFGPAPDTLVDPIPVAALRREIFATMLGWGEDILTHPGRYQSRFYQTYIVLSYCRMLHDLYSGCPGSKRAGAAWAQTHLEARWSGLIDRTWAGRPDPARSVRQPADPADFEATLAFVRMVIAEGSTYAKTIHLA
jgi:hypothetical protein